MTAACGGGPSAVKSGVGSSIIVDAALITEGLTLISPWLVPFAGLIDGFVYDALAQCSTDPPAMPTWSLADLQNIIGGVLNPNFGTALQKLKATVMNYLWYQWCDCTGVPPTVPFVAPTQPSGTTVQTFPSANGCYTGQWSGNLPNSGSGLGAGNIGSAMYPNSITTTPGGVSVFRFTSPPPTGYAYTATVTNPDPALDVSYTLTHSCYDASGTFLGSVTRLIPIPHASTKTVTGTATFPANTAEVTAIFYNGTLGAGPNPATLQLVWSCAGSVPGAPSGPCSSDPATMMLLQQIWQMVQLIQRQAVPFAYVTKASHIGLTGNGQFAVQGLIGVRVMPSTIPPDTGLQIGDPDELWLDSYINWGNAAGWIRREPLTHAPYVSMPTVAGQYTLLGYSLRPGLVVDIAELAREP